MLLIGLTKKLNRTEHGCIELDNANESSINLILMSLFVIDDVDVDVGVDKDDVDAVAVVVVFFLLPTSASPDEFLDSSETWSLLRLLVLHQESEVSICGGNKRIGIILILIRQPKAFSLDNSRRDVNCCLLRLWRRTKGSVVTPQLFSG